MHHFLILHGSISSPRGKSSVKQALFFICISSIDVIDECSEDNIDWDGDEEKASDHQEVGPREDLQSGVVYFLKASLHQAPASGREQSKDGEDSPNLLFI